MKLPKLTPRQHHILLLLYRYRFLNRIQIQALMGHKDYRRINAWLADLRDNHYVEWIYSTDFLEKSKPGIYYLGLNGIRWLKDHQDHPIQEYRKRYRESSRSRGFIDQCVLVADWCIAMNANNTDSLNQSSIHYLYDTQADYFDPESELFFLSESDLIRPHLVIEKTDDTNDTVTGIMRFVEIIEITMPRPRVRKRLKNYIEYLEDGCWQDDAGVESSNPFVMFVCPSLTELIYCKRATKRLLEEKWGEDIRMWFTTADKLKTHGMAAVIWEEVRPPEEDDEDNDEDEDAY